MRIGTDILDLKEFPNYIEGNEKRFFQDNFTENEISYAVSKYNPTLELACLFSIKESLVKADNRLLNTNFNKIEITFIDNVMIYKGYKISSSIDGNYCMSTVIHI